MCDDAVPRRSTLALESRKFAMPPWLGRTLVAYVGIGPIVGVVTYWLIIVVYAFGATDIPHRHDDYVALLFPSMAGAALIYLLGLIPALASGISLCALMVAFPPLRRRWMLRTILATGLGGAAAAIFAWYISVDTEPLLTGMWKFPQFAAIGAIAAAAVAAFYPLKVANDAL
jgi:hypothetical protein